MSNISRTDMMNLYSNDGLNYPSNQKENNMNKILQILVRGVLSLASGNACASESAQDYFDKGLALYNLGKYEESLKSYDKAIELNPEIAEMAHCKSQICYTNF